MHFERDLGVNINHLYNQYEGAILDGCVAPTLASFYMCHVENKIFEDHPDLEPRVYGRYVDDIFMLVDKYEHIIKLKEQMERYSGLKFTYELQVNHKLPFLDVLLTQESYRLSTSRYVKPTSTGEILNYNSLCPKRLKIATIKTLLNRSFDLSSDWKCFINDVENNIKQILTNSNYPMNLIDSEINSFIERKVKNRPPTKNKEKINIFYCHRMSNNYKTEESKLKSIIRNNIQAVQDDHQVCLNIYYKSRKLKNLFIKNSPVDLGLGERSVYLYKCPYGQCNMSNFYVGYTECSLKSRFTNHAQNGSIKKHIQTYHCEVKINTKELMKNVDIIYKANNKFELILAESLMIKSKNPTINEQREFSTGILKVF